MYVSSDKPWFAFLVHPRDVWDLDAMKATSLLRKYTAGEEEYVAKATTLLPLVLGDVRVRGQTVKGEIICVVRMPEVIMQADGMGQVTAAAKLAADRGAPLIGLGALTAPAMGGGARLLRHLPSEVKVTNGNGYTAAVARGNVQEAAEWLGLGNRAKVAVIGCTGSVGGAASRMLVEDGYDIVLLGRTIQRVQNMMSDLAGKVVFAEDFDLLKQADIVLVLTDDRSAKLQPQMMRPGSVVIDVAVPPNIEPERRASFVHYGVPVAKGALAQITGYSCAQDFRLPHTEDTFACLAETYLMAREGLFENSTGRPTVEYARRMERLAAKHGVRPRSIIGDLNAKE